MTPTRLRTAAAGLLALALAACGGGDDPKTSLSGTVTFDSVPNPDGTLHYAKVRAKPVRGVKVEVLQAGSRKPLAATSTDEQGRYRVELPPDSRVVVRVSALMQQTRGEGRWDVSVRDNTRKNALYTMQTGAFDVPRAMAVRDVHAPSGWNGSAYGSTRVAAPFAVLDGLYSVMAKVRSVDPEVRFPKLPVYWSSRNAPADGDAKLGQIGTSHFEPESGGIYVLGKVDVDTDEYDTSVIAHEWGHYYQSAFSRDDSPGGSHGELDLLDRSVAFSEGWGNAWSGIALNRRDYTDSTGPGQADPFVIHLSTKDRDTPGWFKEDTVQYVLWQLNRKVGFAPMHAALTGAFKTGTAITSIHSFAAALGKASPGSAGALRSLLVSQDISGKTDDAFGAAETNDGGIAVALPLYHGGSAAAPPTDACVSDRIVGFNKLGNQVYVRLRSLAAGSHRFTVTGPAGSDPDLRVFQGGLLASGIKVGRTERLTVTKMKAGDVVLAISDANLSGDRVCFSIDVD